MQRGRYHFGPIYVSTRFPLGLVERGLMLDVPDEILVYPRLGRLSASWRQKYLMANELVQRQDFSPGPSDDEFHGIREFRWGDNPRAIHWRTSARQNSVMVREFRQSRDQSLVVLLDLYQPQRPTTADRERVELAVSLAATICVDQCQHAYDAKLSVLVAGQHVTRWQGSCRASGITALLEILAVAEAGSSSDVVGIVEEVSDSQVVGARILLITTRRATDGHDGWPPDLVDESTVRTDANIRLIRADHQELAQFFQPT